MQIIQSIQNRIYELIGVRVMLDFDLARLYEVEARVLNQAVRRNISRFPEDFMFQITSTEWQLLQSQTDNLSSTAMTPSSQIVMMTDIPKNRTGKYLPYAFTEQGVAMLSGVLRSDKAIQMNIAIMRAFVEVRKILLQQNNLGEQIKALKERLGEHDIQLSQIYDALKTYWMKMLPMRSGIKEKGLDLKNRTNNG